MNELFLRVFSFSFLFFLIKSLKSHLGFAISMHFQLNKSHIITGTTVDRKIQIKFSSKADLSYRRNLFILSLTVNRIRCQIP